MRRMASRRATVTWPSLSSIAFWSAGEICLSSAGWLSGRLAPAFLDASLAHACRGAAPAKRHAVASASAVLFVVLVFIRPVLAPEGPILLVGAHDAFEL